MFPTETIGPFVLNKNASGWKNMQYVETFESKHHSQAHIYKIAKSFDNCELVETSGPLAYVDIWEYDQNETWKEALVSQFPQELQNPSVFRFLGPPLTLVMNKVVRKDMVMFDPVSVHKLFYAQLVEKFNGSINDCYQEIADKIEEIVNMFLEETRYRIYSKMNQLRFAFDNREPTYDDIEKLSLQNKEFQEAIGRVSKCAPLLEALYNRDHTLLQKAASRLFA